MVRRWIPLLAVGAVLLHAVPACLGEGDEKLNPQPLPPGEPPSRNDDPTSGENASGGSAAPSPGGTDAGAAPDGDASDGGARDE